MDQLPVASVASSSPVPDPRGVDPAVLPDTGAQALTKVYESMARVLDFAGGENLVYQSRLIGRTGHIDSWMDHRPLRERDPKLKTSLGALISGERSRIVDAVFEAERRVVYTATFQVTAHGERFCELDTDTKLDGDDLNNEGTYLDDLARRPRDGDQVPVWMRPVLARWGAWDPAAGRLTVDELFRANGTPVDMPDIEVDYWLPYEETPEGPRRAHGYGDGNVGPGHTVATPDELAAWRRANT